jgi:methionyl aminopeptidase
MHEEPHVPNYGEAGKGKRLSAGLVVAIEPMVNAGDQEVVIKDDGWTAVTKDGSLSAHFEHSVAITDDGPLVLSRL